MNIRKESATKTKQRVHRSESVKCKFVAEYDLPLRILELLPKLITSVAPASKIPKEIYCSRTKGTELIMKKIGLKSFHLVDDHLRSNRYSMILYESRDVSVTKQLALVVRTVDEEIQKVNDLFLQLIDVKDEMADGIIHWLIHLQNMIYLLLI